MSIVLVGALVYAFVNFLKKLSGRDWNGVVTQLVAWTAGVGAVFLASAAHLEGNIPGTSIGLQALNAAAKIVLGLQAASIFGVVHDVKQAVDNTDTSVEPRLVPPASPPA